MKKNKIKYAKVKFIKDYPVKSSGGVLIPIEDILEFNSNPPTEENNFENRKIYTAFYECEEHPDREKYGVRIGRLCCE